MFIQYTALLFSVFLHNVLLVFGQESNNLPESAASSRVCQGLNSGLGMSGSSQDQYDLYRQRYTNCKYVDGNLEITYLDDTGNWDLSFLESIEEVSGYVLISSVLSQKLHLQNLRLIRGRQLFLDKFSLLVYSNSKPGSRTQGLMELEFRSLQEIMNGTVFISMNNLLCHASTIRWEDINPTVTQHYRTSMDIPGYKRSCGECDAACYNENTGSRHCWGEGPDMCQIINHGPACSPTCTDRCFGEDPSQCCHSECAAGCSGPKATDCHLLVFGQESNNLPESASSSRVCQGLNSGLGMSGSSQDQYDLYRQRYTNCKYVDGNLEITYLDDTGNWDLSFLESIEEVSGYVLISSVLSQKLHLQNLRLIRGRQLFLDKFSLLVASNSKPGSRTQGLMELEFRSLQEIMNGTVYISMNNRLCHASTIRWEDINPTVTQHFRTSMDIPGYKRSCGECDAACYNENTGSRHCWGEGPDMCQIINHGPACSPTCTDRCFGEDPSQCCHSECAAGCSGPKATDCYACKSFVNDGECVSSCPSGKVYNQQHDLDLQENVGGKLTYGILCMKNCPPQLLKDVEQNMCVKNCRPNMHGVDGMCVECDGPCPKTCVGLSGTDYITADNINQFEQCTVITGNLRILEASFQGDVHNNIPGITVGDLQVFKNLKEVTGFVQIQSNDPEMKTVSFLSNLEVIHGMDVDVTQSSLSIMFTQIRTLGLTSLRQIKDGHVTIAYNSLYCTELNIDFQSMLVQKSVQRVRILRNESPEICNNKTALK
ncbi:epidermal growth factor receptor-like [Mytilus trossulus]|uniref:epidermal growth factor receptor-like n=1 Tax=Mytilus trossulus TaxID=6551 RepID=UPI003006DD22